MSSGHACRSKAVRPVRRTAWSSTIRNFIAASIALRRVVMQVARSRSRRPRTSPTTSDPIYSADQSRQFADAALRSGATVRKGYSNVQARQSAILGRRPPHEWSIRRLYPQALGDGIRVGPKSFHKAGPGHPLSSLWKQRERRIAGSPCRFDARSRCDDLRLLHPRKDPRRRRASTFWFGSKSPGGGGSHRRARIPRSGPGKGADGGDDRGSQPHRVARNARLLRRPRQPYAAHRGAVSDHVVFRRHRLRRPYLARGVRASGLVRLRDMSCRLTGATMESGRDQSQPDERRLPTRSENLMTTFVVFIYLCAASTAPADC